MLRAFVLILLIGLVQGQVLSTQEPSIAVGTPTLSAPDQFEANEFGVCLNGTARLVPCAADQWEFAVPSGIASTWITFHFEFLDASFPNTTAFISIHYSETQGYPALDTPGNILDRASVDLFNASNTFDFAYEWTLHCSFQTGFYYMTVESLDKTTDYDFQINDASAYGQQRFNYSVELCLKSVPIIALEPFTSFCDVTDPDASCFISENGPFTTQNDVGFNNISAFEEASIHFSFTTPTQAELGNQFLPGMRVRVHHREEDLGVGDFSLWVVSLRKDSFTSAYYVLTGSRDVCPWDQYSFPEVRGNNSYGAMQVDQIDIWVPRCEMELGTTYYLSVLPPFDHNFPDLIRNVTFWVTIEIDQINPTEIATVNIDQPASFADSVDGFLLPLGYAHELLPGRRNQPPASGSLLDTFIGNFYPLSLPFAPLDLWDDTDGPVDRYERSARWYAIDIPGWDSPSSFPSLEITLKGAQWGRRTDDGQWNQLGFNSAANPFSNSIGEYTDYTGPLADDGARDLASATWLRPSDLSAGMQRFMGFDVDSMRQVDLMISTEGLPLGGLEWISSLSRYNQTELNNYKFNTGPYQGAEGFMNFSGVVPPGHRGLRTPDPALCPQPQLSCRAYPDRYHRQQDDSTSSCRITLDYCQMQTYLGSATRLYIGVAPVKLLWANQDREGIASVGSAAPYEGTALEGSIPSGSAIQGSKPARNVVSRVVSTPYSGNTDSPSSGNWELLYTLQDMDLRFELDINLESNQVNNLGVVSSTGANPLVVNGQAAVDSVDYYSFQVAPEVSETDAFELEVFTAYSQQNAMVEVFEASALTCGMEPIWSCSTSSADPLTAKRAGSCLFRVNGCDLVAGTDYIVAVSSPSEDDLVNDETLSYTLKVTASSLLSDSQWERPLNQAVRVAGYNHYSFQVEENNQTVALRVRISDVQNGKVSAYLRFEGPAGEDTCLLWDYTCSPGGGYHECDLVAPYCVDGAGTYYVSVYGEESSWSAASRTTPANGLIAYVLTPYIHHAEWVDWVPSPDANDPASAVTITRSIPAEISSQGIIKFADDIVKPDVRYFFWNDDQSRLNPHVPGVQQPVIPFAGFRPFGAYSFGEFGASPGAVLGAEAHYYYFEFTPALVNFSGGLASLVASITVNQHQSGDATDDSVSLYMSPYAIANDLCNCWSCVAQPGEDSYSTCKIVLQECDLLPVLDPATGERSPGSDADPEIWYLTVRYDQYDTQAQLPVDYTLQLQMKGQLDVPLTDGQAVYATVSANEYNHYVFVAPSAADTAINVELYINRDLIDNVDFFMGVGQRAGTACPEWSNVEPECETASYEQGRDAPLFTTCTIKIHPCDVIPGENYWFSVYGNPEEGASFFAGSNAEYTLRVWSETAVDLDTDGWPVTGSVTDINHYRITISPDFFSPTFKHLFVQLDAVNGGTVRSWLNKGAIGAACQDSNSCPGQRRPFEGEFELEIDNCQLDSGDEYFLSVAATSFDDAEVPVRYTIRAYTKEVEVVAVSSTDWGRNLSNIELSLERLESVVLVLNPQPLIAAAAAAQTGGANGLAGLAVKAGASVHVHIYDVTWGTFQYWVNTLPLGETAPGDYPYGIGSPECHSQTGGVTGNTRSHSPDNQYEYDSPGNPTLSGTDSQYTFQRVPPDELYLRFACDVQNLQSIYITLVATVVPEWQRLPCDRTLNATVEVWLEVPTILQSPPDEFTFSDGTGATSGLNWATAPEPLTVWGNGKWADYTPKPAPSFDLIWSLTFADEYKMFAYPVDFSVTDSIGIYITASDFAFPDSLTSGFQGLGFPNDVFGTDYEAYFLFVSQSDLAAAATDGNAAVPGEQTNYCGFSLPAHFDWETTSESVLVLTDCMFDYQPGVVFLALRYPPFIRTEYPEINPAVAVAWDFPNPYTTTTRYDFDFANGSQDITTDYLLTHSAPFYTSYIDYEMSMLETTEVDITFPEEWDTLFPFWAYYVEFIPLGVGLEASPIWSYSYIPASNTSTLYPLILEVQDTGVTFDPALRDYSCFGLELSNFTDNQGTDNRIGGGQTCCRIAELAHTRTLRILAANNRVPDLLRGFTPSPFDSPRNNATFRVEVTVFPYHINDTSLVVTEPLTLGVIQYPNVYSVYTYTLDTSTFGPDDILRVELWHNETLSGNTQLELWYSFNSFQFQRVSDFALDRLNSNCFAGGNVLCTIDSSSYEGPLNPTDSRSNTCYEDRKVCQFVPEGVDTIYFSLVLPLTWTQLENLVTVPFQAGFLVDVFSPRSASPLFTPLPFNVSNFNGALKVVEIPFSNFDLSPFEALWSRRSYVSNASLIISLFNFSDINGNPLNCGEVGGSYDFTITIDAVCGDSYNCDTTNTFSVGGRCQIDCRVPICDLDWTNENTVLYLISESLVDDGQISFQIETVVDPRNLTGLPLTDGVWEEFFLNASDVYDAFFFDYVPPASPPADFELSYLEFGIKGDFGFWTNSTLIILNVWPETLCEGSPEVYACSAVPDPWDIAGPARCYIPIDSCNFDRNTPLRWYGDVHVHLSNETQTLLLQNNASPLRGSFNYSLVAQVKYPELVSTSTVLTAGSSFDSDWVEFDRTIDGSQQHHYRFDLPDLASSGSSLTICLTTECAGKPTISPYRWEIVDSNVDSGTWEPPTIDYPEPSQNQELLGLPQFLSENFRASSFVAATEAPVLITQTQFSDVRLFLFQSEFNPNWSREKLLEHLVSVQRGDNESPLRLVPSTLYIIVASSNSDPTNTPLVRHLADPAVDFNINARYFNWENHWATNDCHEFHADLSDPGYAWSYTSNTVCYSLTQCELQSGYVYVSVGARDHFYAYNNSALDFSTSYQLTVETTAREIVPTIELNQWFTLDAAQQDDVDCSSSRSEVAVYLTGIEWGAQVSFQVRSDEVLTDLVRVCPRWGYSNSATLNDPANVLDPTTPNLPVETSDWETLLACDDYSQCTILSDMAYDGTSYIYASSLLDPCDINNGWLYLSLAGLPGTDVDIRLTLDYKNIPTYVLSEAPISGAPVVTLTGQTIPNQWQFYKFNIDNSVPRSAQWRFTVSLTEITGGESVRVTMTRGNAGLPAVPSSGCEQNAINCQSGSDAACLLADSWCESNDAESYWIGVLPQSTVNAVVSFQLEASIIQATFASITACESVCVAVAEGETLFIEFSSTNDLLESLTLFDVRDLQGSVEISVEQGHLPAWPAECHAGSTWLIDSSDLVWQGGDHRTTITPDYFNFFNQIVNVFPTFDFSETQLSPDIWVNNATFTNETIPDPNLADLLSNPDARSYAQERAIAEYSAFRFALPCISSSGSLYFAIYGHEDSTFTFTVRSESLITDANTLVGQVDSYHWKSSPLDGFVATHLAPQAASLLNDYAACEIALTNTGQWPHLYKWDYSETFAAERRPYGWNLQFYQGAEKFPNDGILVVNEDALAAPILAASSSQWPPIPGLNPMALPLANLDDCSAYDISTLAPRQEWFNLEYCDLTPKTLYFFVLFDYQLRRDYFNLPQTAWNGNPVDDLGHTVTTTTTTNTPFTGTTGSTAPIVFPPTTATTAPVVTSSVATTLPTATNFAGTNNPDLYYAPNRWYPFEYKLSVYTLTPPLTVTVGAAPITINMCDYPPSSYPFLGFGEPIRVLIDSNINAPPTGGRLVARLRPLYGNNWLFRYYAGDQPQTCGVVEDIIPLPNDLCSSIAIDWVPGVDQFLWVKNTDSECGCATALLDAYWEDIELPWLAPQPLASVVTGGVGIVQVTDVQSIFLVGSSSMGQVFSLPTDTQAPDFVHIRVAGVTGGNVRAVLLYPDIFTIVGSCNAQYNQVPFFSEVFNASVSPSYAHGLHGECDIFLSPEDVAALTFDPNAPSMFVGVVRDDNIEILNTGTDHIEYYLEVTTSFTPLTNAPATYQMSGYDADFFVSDAVAGSSIVWTIVHESGPGLRISVADNSVLDANTLTLEPVWCFATTCTIELATAAQISPSSDAYYLIVDREYNHWQKDTVYTISHAVGTDNTVSDYLSTVSGLPFCSVIGSVNFTINVVDTNTSYVWDYSPVTLDAKDAEAESRYIGVASYFQGPLSDECLTMLGIWSCLDIIHETNDNGVVLPPCRQQCDDVVTACGAFTLAAALPEFDCGSSRYYQGTEVGQCTGSTVRHVRPPPPPPIFYVNASVPAVTLRTLTTTSGTTTTTTSSTSSTTTTGTDGRTSPFVIPPTPSASPASSLTFSLFLASFLALFIFW